MPKSALIQPDSISVKGQMHDIGGQKLGPVLPDIFYSPLILRYLGEFSVEELQAVEITPLICTLKSELEKIRGSKRQDFFLGRHPIFCLIYLMRLSFFSGCHPKKFWLNSTLFLSGWQKHPSFQS